MGKDLINWAQEKGWYILKGVKNGDWKGEYTYVGARGSSAIDYMFINENVYDRILKNSRLKAELNRIICYW